MTLTLGFSPCPNDTFIFDALVNRKIDTEGLDFEVFLEDVETLNEWAMQGKLDISKVSYGVLPFLTSQYDLLDSGGALGKGVGPLVIARTDGVSVDESRIAIPGRHTTAHLLFAMAFPKAKQKEFMLFSGIEDAVLSGRVDCGVIIHENRFTYHQKGLVKLLDLGAFWEARTGVPIPLGGILIRSDLGPALHSRVNALIRTSLQYAFDRYPVLPDYVRLHAQAMNEDVMRQHIDLYVNEFSLNLGEEGRKAIAMLNQSAGDLRPHSAAPSN